MEIYSFAFIGMIFGMVALYKINKLEKALKEKGVIEQDYNSDK